MDLWGSLRVVLRRWYVVLPALAITVAVALVAGSRVQVTYTAVGSTQFLASNAQKTTNPYNDFGQSLQTTAQIVGDDVDSDSVRNVFLKNGLNSTYTIEVPYDPTRAVLLPQVTYTVEDESPQVALKTVEAIGKSVSEQLKKRQENSGAPIETWIQAVPGPTSDTATENTGNRIRTTAILLLLGAAISLSLAFVAEGFATARRRRREKRVLAAADTAPVRLPVDVTEEPVAAASGDAARATTGNGNGDGPHAAPMERSGARPKRRR